MTATAENITIGISALSLLGIFIKSFFKREEKKDTEENSQSKMLIEAMTTQLKGLVETVANQKNSEIKELAEVVKLSVNKQDKITETIQELVKAMKDYTEDMVVILEDSEVAIERLFKVNRDIVEMFENVIRIKEVGVKEWVEIAKDYARRRGYIVDEMGTLALHVKIGNAYSRELKLETEEIESIIDEAIEKAKRKKRYAKKHRIEGFAVLREADFM